MAAIRTAKVTTATVAGVEAFPITVEAAVELGLPGIGVVGMSEIEAKEARSRVRTAIFSAGYEMPRETVIISVTPSAPRHRLGSGVDLAMAAAVLAASRQIAPIGDDAILFGELALDGSVREARGDACARQLAERLGRQLVHAKGSVGGRCALSLRDLREGIGGLPEGAEPGPASPAAEPSLEGVEAGPLEEALATAALGRHALLVVGGEVAPSIARELAAAMGPLDEAGRAVVEAAYSACSLPVPEGRPACAPHSSASSAALVGGGRPVMPGEATLASEGALLLCDLQRFEPAALRALKAALERGEAHIVRAEGACVMPARPWAVASAAPCPCGHLGDPGTECTCAAETIRRYQAAVAGALPFEMSLSLPAGEALEADFGAVAALVARGRRAREGRAGELAVDDEASKALAGLAGRLALTKRRQRAIERVARSLADVRGHASVSADDMAQAAAWRVTA